MAESTGSGRAAVGDPGTEWRRRDDVLWRRSIDAVVLLPKGADEPVTLPGTGAAVWDLLEEPATLGQLVETLSEVYGGQPSTIAHDVAALLDELEAMAVVART
jgi:hypothetical protein